MKRKLIFLLLAVSLLTPWPVAYAYGDVLAGNTPVQIEAAESTATPELNAFGKAIGGVTPGDLFYVDTGNVTVDTTFILYITNTDELARHYRYMTLNVGIYIQTGTDRWEKLTAGEGETLPDTYLTMHNGNVDLTLPGYARYKITIDKGCFYCYGTGTDKNAVLPKFYLAMR